MDPLQATVEVTDEGVEVRAPETQDDTSLTELIPLQGMLGIDEAGARQRTQMKTVWEYFGKDAQGIGDALFKIKQTELKLTPPRLGESRLSKLYNFVQLKNKTADLEAQLESL